MDYIVSFYNSGNSSNIPTVWPSELKPFTQPTFISGSGFLLADQTYYSGELTSDYINANKPQFNISDTQTYFNGSEYQNYIQQHQSEYDSWKISNRNPSVREVNITAIKYEAQKRIVAPLGYTPEETDKWVSKEINLTAGAAQILLKIIQGTVTSGDLATLQSLQNFFSGVNAIRNYSNYLGDLATSGVDFDILSGWPM